MVDLVTTLGAAAGTYAASQSAATYVEDVFSTYTYTGLGSVPQTIDNGIALADSQEYAVYIAGDGNTSGTGYTRATTDAANNIYVATLHESNVVLVRKYSQNYQNLLWEKYFEANIESISGITKIYCSENNNIYELLHFIKK